MNLLVDQIIDLAGCKEATTWNSTQSVEPLLYLLSFYSDRSHWSPVGALIDLELQLSFTKLRSRSLLIAHENGNRQSTSVALAKCLTQSARWHLCTAYRMLVWFKS